MNTTLKIISALLLIFPPVIYANDIYAYGNQLYTNCLAKVMDVKSGNIIKVEMKIEKGRFVYEFDIRDEDNQDWDVECAADTAKVIELEKETFGPNDWVFLKHKKINLDEAKTAALSKYPGEIVEIEYEIEEDGLAVYEFDINMDDGKQMKVEIDAATATIHEETEEIWQFGYE